MPVDVFRHEKTVPHCGGSLPVLTFGFTILVLILNQLAVFLTLRITTGMGVVNLCVKKQQHIRMKHAGFPKKPTRNLRNSL